ncbi:MAG: VWA domain-containing protein [Candidatus Eisenbacteria bacterium]|uniref:VWA domain-containing protein n=1 Tax=Eiseniibacteriota bacterium TaxID=2212470 RepID=A0A9D6L7V8_UNCEI|nr:VWA domain-containing protein [Candidatus Eisenbacteria bacterium]MBI3539235.1 VWA domain-containing protein [Candidatus Eisenbacteria bacterium]
MRWDAPWALAAVLVLPLLAARARRPLARRAAVLWVRVGGPWSRSRMAVALKTVGLLPWLALALALLALARPQQGLRQSETETRGVDIVLALDISPSMRAEDFVPRNRLFVAKETAREFIRQRPHDRIGLVAFAATAFTQCPLTLDHGVLIELLDGIEFGMAEDGTAIGMGLATAVARLKESRTPSKVVVLLTDGENNRGEIDPLTGAELARTMGVKVYTVLVGRGGMVPVPVDDPIYGRRVQMERMDVDEGALREIAARTGGRYFRAVDSDALAGIYAEIDRLERAPIRSIEYREYDDLGPLLLGAAALLLALHALSGATWAFRLP